MFRNLLQFWKGKDFLRQVLEEFKNMLEDSHIMFKAVCESLIENKKQPGLEDKIYEIDKKINELQRDIRRRIIEHLSVQPSVDVSTCLVLMSVVKDAERLGDYAKNLLEVNKLLKKEIDKGVYSDFFSNTDEEISELFRQTK
ncbi:MAG: hypothetical protein GF375_06440, partial [Candidatus Omnitrophica bacterium]|nr:hypothetical protein [Candidatus Omnitrophota bacterium]MBD3269613.1 hypothetical protein [Candidatus Omnitrophota bacterium]